MSEQNRLPGVPAARQAGLPFENKPLWPPAKSHHGIVPIEAITLSFTGTIELTSGLAKHHDLAAALVLSKPLHLAVSGVVLSTDGHKNTKDGVIGVATVTVTAAALFEDIEARWLTELALMEDAVRWHSGEGGEA